MRILGIVAALCLMAAPASADDEADVNGAVDAYLAALNANDAPAAAALVVDGYLSYVGPNPVPIVGKAAMQQGLTQLFGGTEQWQFNQIGARHGSNHWRHRRDYFQRGGILQARRRPVPDGFHQRDDCADQGGQRLDDRGKHGAPRPTRVRSLS